MYVAHLFDTVNDRIIKMSTTSSTPLRLPNELNDLLKVHTLILNTTKCIYKLYSAPFLLQIGIVFSGTGIAINSYCVIVSVRSSAFTKCPIAFVIISLIELALLCCELLYYTKVFGCGLLTVAFTREKYWPKYNYIVNWVIAGNW